MAKIGDVTLRYIRDEILNLFRGGKYSDDEIISPKQIEFEILQYRSLFIRRDSDRPGFRFTDFEQYIPCVPLQVVDKVSCCNNTMECYKLRSVDKLPKRVRTRIQYPLKVYSTDDEKIIPLTEGFLASFNNYYRFTPTQRRSWIRNEYLWLKNDSLIRQVNLIGIFDNPILASKLGVCEGDNDCMTIDDSFPIGLDMVDGIVQAILTNKLGITRYGQSDEKNDGEQESVHYER
ncbi:MAG: hypothetical protein U9Q40_03105 [Campylobacterota bacterium]|nr:hypothetical protein [Campylobacterota bacterium]